MRKQLFSFASSLFLLFLPVLVYGNSFVGYVTVSEARNLPNNSWVILTGNIVNVLPGGKYYTFRDATGEIVAEIERKVWRGSSYGPSDRVEIHGYVEVSRGQVSIEAKAIAGTGTVTPVPGQVVTITQPITIIEARRLANNSWVVLTGNIVNEIRRGEYFTFRDATGDIVVEIERKVWRGLSVGVSDVVEIHGYVEISGGQVGIEVKAIRRL